MKNALHAQWYGKGEKIKPIAPAIVELHLFEGSVSQSSRQLVSQ